MIVLDSLYFFLPAYIANMSPVLFRKLPIANKIINAKVFGKNKTWRGVLIASIMGTLVFYLQKIAYISGFTKFALIDYSDFSLTLGFLLGLGAITGDLVKSYYKRKAKIEPGKPWPFWDQEDFVFGALILSFFVYVPPAEVAAVLMLASPLLHVAANYLGYLLGIRKVKF